jgi:PadR family transcriptional regulator PadR
VRHNWVGVAGVSAWAGHLWARLFFDSDCLLCQHLGRLAVSDVVNLGEFEHMVLLAIMRLGDDAYAVPVREEIERCTGRDISRGSIYITLDRLETKGYLRSRLADPTPERGGRAKRYYVLRPRAIDALKESRRALVALWRGLETALS